MTGPVARSLQLLRKEGWHAESVSRWNPHAMRTFDLFSWVDIVCVRADRPGVLGVQATTGDHVGHRVEKARGNAHLVAWLGAGNGLVVHGWARRGARGARKLWTCRIVQVGPEDVRCDST